MRPCHLTSPDHINLIDSIQSWKLNFVVVPGLMTLNVVFKSPILCKQLTMVFYLIRTDNVQQWNEGGKKGKPYIFNIIFISLQLMFAGARREWLEASYIYTTLFNIIVHLFIAGEHWNMKTRRSTKRRAINDLKKKKKQLA